VLLGCVYRPYNNITLTPFYDKFKDISKCLNSIDWDQIYFKTSIDEKVDFLESNLNYLFDCLVPVKTVKVKNNGNPWFTEEIKQKITERNRAYSQWKRFRLQDDYLKYKCLKNNLAKAIKNAKLKFYEKKFSDALCAKQTWKNIKDIGIGGRESAKNDLANLDELNQKFAGISSCDSNTTNCDNRSNRSASLQNCDVLNDVIDPSDTLVFNYNSQIEVVVDQTNTCDKTFSFKNVYSDEVYKSILSIKSNSTGLDNINPKFLKMILLPILPHITHIFNSILTTSVFPKSWKRVKITPIPKSENEYRPIAILSVLSKALEKIMSQQMADFFLENKMLTTKQSGFRPKRSCVTALIKVCEDIRKSVDTNEIVFLLLLDFSKAFDNVNHRQLLKKLRHLFNFSSSAIKLIASYLSKRMQMVCSGNNSSEFIQLFKGVPQGSVLGPLLFSIYINDLPNFIQTSSLHMYADDVQLYKNCGRNSMQQCAIDINSDLNAVSNWAKQNGLCLNPAKSKYLVISRKPVNCCDIRLYIDDVEIELVQKAKNLGIVFNNRLTFSDHVNLTVAKTYGMLRNLWATQHFTPQNIRLLLAKTYLLPKLLYGCELFANLDSVCYRKMRVLCNNITRYVFKRKRFESVSMFSHQIYGPSLKCLLDSRSLILMHKIMHTKEPAYLYDQISFSRSERTNNVVNLRFNYLLSERHFFVHTTRLWNKLPNDLKNISNANSFKYKLRSHFHFTPDLEEA